MKKLAVLLIACFLAGCTSENREMERSLELRSNLLAANGCSFETQITADYGDSIHMFSLSCRADAQGDLSFTVNQPETITGISGTVSQSGGKLTFDDVALQFPMLADDQVTPVTAPWLFLKTLRGGYITSVGKEDDLLRLTVYDSYEEDALQTDIWVNESDQPVRCEILYDGRKILSLDVINFQTL